MMFAQQLRERVMRGEITCSIRIWHRPRVRTGGCYALGPGAIHVTSIREIVIADVTPELCRRSGFDNIEALLAVARHGRGENIYLIEFDYRE